MVKLVRERTPSQQYPNCEGITSTLCHCSPYGPDSVAGVEHVSGDVKARLVAWQRLVQPALAS